MAMTAHVVYSAIDPSNAGDDVGQGGQRDHPRRDRLRRAADERRHLDEGTFWGFPDKGRGDPCGGLRYRPSLQRRDGRNAGIASRTTGRFKGKSLERAERALTYIENRDAASKRPIDPRRVRRLFRGGGLSSQGDTTRQWRTTCRQQGRRRPRRWTVCGPRTTIPGLTGEPSLVVDVDGFEGPLDLLLHLARNQKVDLARISILALAEQYLAFVEKVRALRLELAADYLVMAAWLAYLKSKLLIPKQPGEDGESGEELAAVLQFRLKRLEAMRDAAARLVNRNRLGRDVFAARHAGSGHHRKAQRLFGARSTIS